jgi:hypothetical protein
MQSFPRLAIVFLTAPLGIVGASPLGSTLAEQRVKLKDNRSQISPARGQMSI